MNSNLQYSLFNNRTGGSIAIRGFEFQFIYTCYRLLIELDGNNSMAKLCLEGLEDLDIIHKKEHIQLKTSIKPIDANFLISNNILKNFLELYLFDKESKFKLIHNSSITDGNLKKLELKRIDKKALEHWNKKIKEIDTTNSIDINDFLHKISFEKFKAEDLFIKSKKLILEKFNLTTGTEEQFLFSLLHHISIWSIERKEIDYNDLLKVMICQQKIGHKISNLTNHF